MREQRIDATLRRRRIENELGSSVLLRYSVVMADHHRAVGTAVDGNTQPKQAEIDPKRQNGRSENEQQDSEEDPP